MKATGLALVFALTTGITLAGCAAQESASPTSSPSPNDLANAIEMTAARGTAAMEIEIRSPFEFLTGVGRAALTSDRGQVTWSSDKTDDSITELVNSDGLFTLIDDQWFQTPMGTVTPTSAAIQPLTGLNELLTSPENTLVGTLPLTIESGLNFSEEELVNLPSECVREVSVSITTDQSGLITTIQKDFTCTDNDRSSVTTLSGFGSPLDLSEPIDPIEVPGTQ
jgi:hypothetical protein